VVYGSDSGGRGGSRGGVGCSDGDNNYGPAIAETAPAVGRQVAYTFFLLGDDAVVASLRPDVAKVAPWIAGSAALDRGVRRPGVFQKAEEVGGSDRS
jgi:hypothetical protein